MNDSKPLSRMYFSGALAAHGAGRIAPEEAHHLVHVLSLATGDALTLFDGQGTEYDVRIESVGKTGVSFRVLAQRTVSRESALNICVAQGISSGERMDYTVQKAVELGVTALQPLATQRSVVRLDAQRAARRVAHWQAVAVAACEQCGRNQIPRVAPVMPLEKWLGEARDYAATRLVLSPTGEQRLTQLVRPRDTVWLLAGAEGGFTADELAAAASVGFASVRLGPRILRTETAAIAAIAAMQALWGDF
ncbi:MAG TPA: 16S rRNA (uracil(1498)-N(3))-methyltransferase [Burkholderiales bacterium]|nr:16S rRNA (uracil(1498)-N(3))-methyltransferase [Burkholderiales bacterium]